MNYLRKIKSTFAIKLILKDKLVDQLIYVQLGTK